MARDLKEMFAKERERVHSMKEGHEARFLSKLEKELPASAQKRSTQLFWIRVAASVVVILGVTAYFLSGEQKISLVTDQVVGNETKTKTQQTLSLGDLSPDLQKVENYYLTNINLQLSDLESNPENKEVLDSYMTRLAELDAEYRRLNVELNEIGPNDQTIGALVKNLQLRLQLLQRLKSKLNQLKSSKNEQESSNMV
jgi:predicted RNase H-like nuclease (RuvC/YqgF family)